MTLLMWGALGLVLAATIAAAGTSGWLDGWGIRVVSANDEWGRFPASPRAELLDDGRTLRLLEDFVYLDPRGRRWLAAKGAEVNGASIPRAFWSVAGGPLDGRYRNASIVHDEGCVQRTAAWQDVHRMFYEACRCGGLPERQAKILYAAVYHFGPRWIVEPEHSPTADDDVSRSESLIGPDRSSAEAGHDAREKLERFIAERRPTLAEIDAFAPF
ncbi:MAG TPA: DUF1353 domain-containing protein [Pirellulales bacterium]